MKKTTIASKARYTYLDVLNIIAIIAVLFMHHDFGAHHFATGRTWFFDLALKIIMYFCIPVFLMCTGSTLLGYKKRYDTRTFFKKRFVKILIPMVAWFLIVGFFRVVVFRDLTLPEFTLPSIMRFIMTGKVLDFYWFLFLIIGIYFTIPILTPLSEEKHKSLLKYAIIALFIFNMLLPGIANVMNLTYNSDLYVKISSYMIYPLIGYYLSTYNIQKKRNRAILYNSGLLAILYQYIITSVLSYGANRSVLTALGYTEFPTAIYATAIFCFIRNARLDFSGKIQNLLAKMASCSFGIYLIHYLVMRLEGVVFGPVGINSKTWVWRFLFPFLTYAICVGIVLLLKKIPFLRRIVP